MLALMIAPCVCVTAGNSVETIGVGGGGGPGIKGAANCTTEAFNPTVTLLCGRVFTEVGPVLFGTVDIGNVGIPILVIGGIVTDGNGGGDETVDDIVNDSKLGIVGGGKL